jgi:hypothetical protein
VPFAKWAVAIFVIAALAVAPAWASLVIIPTYAANITNDANAAVIKGVIQTAINTYEASFTDNITVNITFQEMNNGLGSSSTFFGTESYASYLSQLTADKKTADDTAAIAHLPTAAQFSTVFGTTNINVKTANARAIGFDLNPPAGSPDGTISLNTSITSPGSSGATSQYSLLAVTEHEIDEVLGLGSALPTPSPSGNPFPEDLFRYGSTAGVRSYTATTSATAFFSIDGTTHLAEFNNQTTAADFGDWRSNPLPAGAQSKVQDAFATPGAAPALSVELRALDVIGYDSAVPEPSTVFLFTTALGALGLARRRIGMRMIA